MKRTALSTFFLLAFLSLLSLAAACGGETADFEVTSARFPAKLAFAPDGRLFYSEQRTGDIRIVSAEGELLAEPFAHVDVAAEQVAKIQLWGLFGLAFDPEFTSNHYVYAYLIRPTVEGGQGVVMRFTDVDNQGTDPTVILADLPESSTTEATPHIGGGLLFGPDGYLYLSLGDFGPSAELYSPSLDPQDLSVLPGKIIRVNRDGSTPPDNPFVDEPDADPRIFAYGFRNPYDFTFHPVTGRMYATDNGLDNCDELNAVDKGQNYGWPQSRGEGCQTAQAADPIYLYSKPDKPPEELSSNVGPTAVEFVSGDIYPTLGDSLLVCEWNTGFMRRLALGGDNLDEVLSDDVIAKGCQLDIAISPDGIIYYSNGSEIRRLVEGEPEEPGE